jgi:hypothetical protein
MDNTISKNSWFTKNWKWVVPSAGCLSILVIAAVFALFLYKGITNFFEKSTPYKEAIELVLDNEEVQSVLGKPIEVSGFIKGGLKEAGESGNANFEIPLKGSKLKGTLYVIANKNENQWTFEVLTVTIAKNNKKINLLSNIKKTDF